MIRDELSPERIKEIAEENLAKFPAPNTKTVKTPTGHTFEVEVIDGVLDEIEKEIILPENPRLQYDEKEGFVAAYIEAMRHRTDAYGEYLYAGALSLLSCAVNKRAYLPLNFSTIYPNIWLFLLGQSTVSRKTTACKEVQGLLFEDMPWLIVSYPGSPEAFIEDLEGDERVDGEKNKGHGILIREEAAGLLALMQRQYMNDMRDTLCHLYDCLPFARRVRSGQRKKKHFFNLQDPYLSFLFATTPEVFSQRTTVEDITSGWLLRFLFFFPNYDRPLKDAATMTDEGREAYNRVKKQFRALRDFFKVHDVEFALTTAGLQIYNEWRRRHEAELMTTRKEDQGLFSRLSIYALKLAMLYTVSLPDFLDRAGMRLVEIPDHELKTALKHVDTFFLPSARLIIDTVGKNEERNVMDQILGTIKRAGGKLSRINLIKRIHRTRREMDDALDALMEGEELIQHKGPGGTWYSLR